MAMLEGKMIAMIAIGFTHYVDIGKSEDAVIYYPNATEVHMTLPGGPTLSGRWEVLADGYFVKWTDGPEGKWQIESSAGVLVYIDPTGKPAGNVTRIIAGNPAKF